MSSDSDPATANERAGGGPSQRGVDRPVDRSDRSAARTDEIADASDDRTDRAGRRVGRRMAALAVVVGVVLVVVPEPATSLAGLLLALLGVVGLLVSWFRG